MFESLEVEWAIIGKHCVTLAIAYVLALPIAMDRERAERTAGLRTFPLVAVAACGFMLTGFELLSAADTGRVMQGLITGIGFIGGGAILKRDDGIVQGTATAASLWTTGAIGLAVAGGRIEIAIVLSTITFLTLRLLKPVKEQMEED